MVRWLAPGALISRASSICFMVKVAARGAVSYRVQRAFLHRMFGSRDSPRVRATGRKWKLN